MYELCVTCMERQSFQRHVSMLLKYVGANARECFQSVPTIGIELAGLKIKQTESTYFHIVNNDWSASV